MVDPQLVRRAVLEYKAVMGGPALVHLHPGDVDDLTDQDREVITAGGGTAITADPDVPPGGYSVGRA